MPYAPDWPDEALGLNALRLQFLQRCFDIQCGVLLMNVEVYTVGALGQLPSAPVLGIGIVNSVLGWFWLRPSYNNMRRTKRTLVEVEERYHVHITPRRMTFIDFWASGGLLLGAILSGPIFTWIFNLGR